MSIALIITGSVIVVYGVVLCIMMNLTTGAIMTLLLGILFLGWGIFSNKMKKAFSDKVYKIIRVSVYVVFCAELIFISFLGIYGQIDNVRYDEDAVVVLGAGVHGDKVTVTLQMRLDKAIEYHRKNPEALIVVTGGKGFQETVTEAYAMEKYLIENGVDSSVIVKEEKATSTNENMRFSKEILDTYFEGDYCIAVVTNDFHIYRGVHIAKIEGFDNVSHIHAETQWYNIMPCYLRETLAVLKMWMLG